MLYLCIEKQFAMQQTIISLL